MKIITVLGDGLIFLPVFLIATFTGRKKFPYRILFIFLLHAAILVFMKQVLFHNSGRPITFFSDLDVLHFVEGVEVHSRRSFPSGHTASAFAMATLLAFMYKKSHVLILSFLGACMVGFSRMYLLQHFFYDVVIGALIGFTCAYLICLLPIPDARWVDQLTLKMKLLLKPRKQSKNTSLT